METIAKPTARELSHNDRIIVMDHTPFINVKENQTGRVVDHIDRDPEEIMLKHYASTLQMIHEKNKSVNQDEHVIAIEFFDDYNNVYFLQMIPKRKEHLYIVKDNF
jgi:hypothetical protein